MIMDLLLYRLPIEQVTSMQPGAIVCQFPELKWRTFTVLLVRITHIVLSLWLSLLLVFGTTSMEFIHLFADHEDTVHCGQVKDGELYFDIEHHHCVFVSFTFSDFYHAPDAPRVSWFMKYFQEYQSSVPSFVTQKETIRTLLRGPPTATC